MSPCGCGKSKKTPVARRGFTASASADPAKPNAIDRAARIQADKAKRLNGG